MVQTKICYRIQHCCAGLRFFGRHTRDAWSGHDGGVGGSAGVTRARGGRICARGRGNEPLIEGRFGMAHARLAERERLRRGKRWAGERWRARRRRPGGQRDGRPVSYYALWIGFEMRQFLQKVG